MTTKVSKITTEGGHPGWNIVTEGDECRIEASRIPDREEISVDFFSLEDGEHDYGFDICYDEVEALIRVLETLVYGDY